MRRSVWMIAAACCGVVFGGCGKTLEPTGSSGRARGKGDAPLVAQLDQLKTFSKPNVLVSQYSSCDEACMNQVDPVSGGVRGASPRCCTPFSPTALTTQTFGGACPEGLNQTLTGACQIFGGGHVVYLPKDCDPFDTDSDACGSGTCGMDGYCVHAGGTGREVIDYQNQAKNLHPDLKANSDYHKFNEGLTECTSNTSSDLCGAGVEDVFASQWWPQSENGIAWRWVPGATQGFEDFSDAKTFSPAEKYDLMFSNLSSSCAADDQVTVGGKTFCPVKVKCGSNKCENADGDEISCTSADAKFCINYGWADLQDGCPDNPEEGVTCTPVKNPMTKVIGPATKWELENHGKYQNVSPDSWWGHCNGWASYATAEKEKYPKEDICVKLVDNKITRCTSDATAVAQCGTGTTEGCVLFRMGDIEALMSEVYFSDAATFTGKRCNVRPDDIEYDDMGRPKQDECRDINAGTLHVAVTGMLGTGVKPFAGGDKTKLSFVIDHNWDHQVWNFPLVKFQFDKVTKIAQDGSNCEPALPTAEEAEAAGDTDLAEMIRTQPLDRVCAARIVSLASNGDYSKLNPSPSTSQYVMVKMRYWMVSDGVSAYKMMKRADQRGVSPHETTLNYVLELDGEGKILGGEWTKDPTYSWGSDSKEAHPDFLWAAIKPAGYGGEDDLSDQDNKAMNYLKIRDLLRCANDASTCGGDDGGNNGGGGEPGEQVLLEVSGEQVARMATKDYEVTIPTGATEVKVLLTPTAGDPDLTKPCNDWKYDLEPEQCTVAQPEAGATLAIQTKGFKDTNTYDLKVVATVASDGGGGDPPPPPPVANICADHCGGSVTIGESTCYCDTACSNDDYQDCCQNDSGGTGGGRSYVDAVCGG